MKKYGVIMAGGGGTRFWPLSRQKTPKQLLNLTGKDLMVNEAIERLSYTVDMNDIFVVTNEVQIRAMKEATTGRIRTDHILSEPSSRNTAACIGYTALEIVKKYGDGVMIITPSDAYIRDTASFTRVLAIAINEAEVQDKLITIGITPKFPATEYGYIKFDKSHMTAAKIVTEFKEKPDKETAMAYISTNAYVWNSGMFIWRASTILKKFEKYVPDIYIALMKIGEAMNSDAEQRVIKEIYPNIRNISVDYAIMEPSAADGDVLVVPGEFGWNDVGSWDMMGVLHSSDANGNVMLGDTITLNTTNSILYSNRKVIATVGVDNLIVVDMPDVVMVCSKDKAQDVKLIVDKLNAENRTELL